MKRMRIPFAQTGLLAVLLAVAGGCATQNHFAEHTVLADDASRGDAVPRARQTLAQVFPARYRATHRAVITVAGKQFACDALLSVSPAEGGHLALVSSLGTVTDLRVRADGATELLKVTPLLRADWSRNYVARDLRELFLPPQKIDPAGRLADGRLVLQTPADAGGVVGEYVFSADRSRWEELSLVRQGKTFYRAVIRRYSKWPALAAEVPAEFDVTAESYRIELRVTSLETEERP
jgi:hypothetical protein